jgi:hypothetical protein
MVSSQFMSVLGCSLPIRSFVCVLHLLLSSGRAVSPTLAALILIWTLLKSPFDFSLRWKGKKRLLFDRALLHLTSSFNNAQLQAFTPPTNQVYAQVMKKAKMEQIVDEIGENARILWVGGRRPGPDDRVVLHFHGKYIHCLKCRLFLLMQLYDPQGEAMWLPFWMVPSSCGCISKKS